MEREAAHSTDSQAGTQGECVGSVAGGVWGGVIPGSGGMAAFCLTGPAPSAVPVLIAVPHAGRAYPDALLAALRDPTVAPARLEDRLVDRLAQAVADATGASLLVAQAPRAMIDLNRAPHDIDWGMIANAGPPDIRRGGANGSPNSGRARGGLGLVPRRLPGVGELWKAPLTRPELMARIEGVHRPYHACLADTLAALRARWGAALLIDLHSMPPLPVKSVAYSGGRGAGTARVVLGDRFGGSCAGSLVATAFATLAERRMPAAHNRPYAGGFGLERHGAPSRGIHAVQVEVDRSCYLDSRLLELGEGFDVTVALLVDLVRRLAGEVAMLGAGAGGTEGTSRWPFAAE